MQGRESEEHYSADLVKKKFLGSVGTGLLNDNIKFQIKHFLDNLDMTDKTLIERVNEVANLETERLNKVNWNSTKMPRVNELQTTSDTWDSLQDFNLEHTANEVHERALQGKDKNSSPPT